MSGNRCFGHWKLLIIRIDIFWESYGLLFLLYDLRLNYFLLLLFLLFNQLWITALRVILRVILILRLPISVNISWNVWIRWTRLKLRLHMTCFRLCSRHSACSIRIRGNSATSHRLNTLLHHLLVLVLWHLLKTKIDNMLL
jgi:hypothetical protein